MRRRHFLLAPVLLAPEGERNKLAQEGNEFGALYTAWAEQINKCKDGVYELGEAAAFEAAAKQWRRLEKVRRDWLRWAV